MMGRSVNCHCHITNNANIILVEPMEMLYTFVAAPTIFHGADQTFKRTPLQMQSNSHEAHEEISTTMATYTWYCSWVGSHVSVTVCVISCNKATPYAGIVSRTVKKMTASRARAKPGNLYHMITLLVFIGNP